MSQGFMVDRPTDEPAVVVTITSSFDINKERLRMLEQIVWKLSQIEGHAYLIYDCSGYEGHFADLLLTMPQASAPIHTHGGSSNGHHVPEIVVSNVVVGCPVNLSESPHLLRTGQPDEIRAFDSIIDALVYVHQTNREQKTA